MARCLCPPRASFPFHRTRPHKPQRPPLELIRVRRRQRRQRFTSPRFLAFLEPKSSLSPVLQFFSCLPSLVVPSLVSQNLLCGLEVDSCFVPVLLKKVEKIRSTE